MHEMRLRELPLQFGVFDWIEWEGKRPYSEIFEERLQMLEYADQQGFFCYHLAEHHVTPLSLAPSPGVFLTAAAERSHRIRLGPLLYLLPFYDPLRLAHEICILDHLTRGRLELGVGQGAAPVQAGKFLIKTGETWDISREMLDLLIAAFTRKELYFEGNYYSYKGICLWMHPFQQPYPPLWYDRPNFVTVPWMAQQGLHCVQWFETAMAARPYFDLYQQHWGKHRDDPKRLNNHITAPKLGLIRHIYVADTDARARRECRGAFPHRSDHVNFPWTQQGSHRANPMANVDELLETGGIIAGSPQTVSQQVKRQAEEAGINYFGGIFAFGNLGHTQVMGSMRLFVEEVMPTFTPRAR
jgi:alkanesulfonate monooxygenase SsuD/methylene tetrahydromethanopterin reductase-like flavin-dependent oxidoreductase (luciferase family)